MKKIIELYQSERKYLLLGYIFLLIAVYNVLDKNRRNYELLFIISATQFLLYYIKIWLKRRKLTK